MSANERQIGGDHYKTEYEHWDLVLATGMGYLEGCATKYVARWRKKGGVADLDKALHYVEKLQENALFLVSQRALDYVETSSRVENEVNQFCAINRLAGFERAVILRLANWNVDRLVDAHKRIAGWIRYTNEGGDLPDPEPVPLTEENHYGERASKDN